MLAYVGWSVAGLVILWLLLLGWSLCRISADADRRIAEMRDD